MSAGTIQQGDIRFLDNGIPDLTAGTYKISVAQTITDPSYEIDATYKADQQIIVQSPRFSLPGTAFVSLYPLPGISDPHNTLPFIVFNDKHLPWCRLIGEGLDGKTPWMALMIFKADELIYQAPETGQPSPTLSTIRNISDVVKLNTATTAGPAIDLDPVENQNEATMVTNTIDVLLSTFQALAPKYAELPYLAHVRQISSDANVTNDAVGEKFYSTILANRLSDPLNTTNYIAHLVSLEGWSDFLPGGNGTLKAGQTTLRLISLYDWTYTAKAAGANFGELVKGLNVGALKLPFSPPAGWGAAPGNYSAAQTEVKNKYDKGYVALNYGTRTGESTFAWYRGPFVPTVPVIVTNAGSAAGPNPLLNTTDQAIIYDPATGVFDQSYAVAWELGRMLTLANRTAALALWQWKRQGMQKVQVLNRIVINKTNSKLRRQGPGNTLSWQEMLDGFNWDDIAQQILDGNAGRHRFMNYLGRSLGKQILGGSLPGGLPVITALEPSGLDKHLETMPGLLHQREIFSSLQNGIDPHVLINQKLKALLSD